MNGEEPAREERRRTSGVKAATSHSWWPGWIWAVPLAALGIGAWLLVRWLTQGGTDITINFADAYGIAPGDTSIVYLGTKVGSVQSVSLTKDGKSVEVEASIKDEASKFLTAGTIFYLRGAQPSLSNLSSLGAVLSGPTIVMEPGSGAKATQFQGLEQKPKLPREHGPPVLFSALFDGAVGDLHEGDAVKLRGFAVGEVRQTGFHFDAGSGKIRTPVTFALYPALFHIENRGGGGASASTSDFRGEIAQLVERGLRANLSRDPPLIGGYRVGLELIPGAPHATLNVAESLPEIPAAPGGGLQSIVDRFQNVPIDQIAQNLLAITHHIDEVVSSPKLKESVAELHASLEEIHQTVADVGPKVDKLVQTLRDTSQQLDQAASSADRTLGGPASQTGLQDTLREMKEAARSVRGLADYLERHPEALIKGKPGE